MATAEALAESARKAKMQERADELFRGEKVIPLRCGECRSPSVIPSQLEDERHSLVCQQCGRLTSKVIAKRLRTQEIRAYIENGVV